MSKMNDDEDEVMMMMMTKADNRLQMAAKV